MANILIVEDEEVIHELIKRNLSLVGHTCDSAFDGKEALECLADKKYDLMILDIMFPKEDGFQVMRQAKEQPTIFLTARDSLQDRITGFSLGADDYITKPFEMLEMLARVEAVSGQLHGLLHDRVLNGSSNRGFDSSLNQNTGDYQSLAKEMAIKLRAIKGAISKVEYQGQGMTNNDPDIFFNLTGEGGDRAQLRFSRHDKALLGIVFDAGMKEMDVSEQQAEDFAKRAEAYFQQNPGAESYSE